MTAGRPGDELSELWRRSRAVLRHQLGERMFKDGIDSIRPVSMDDALIVLACPSTDMREHVVKRYGTCIANVLAYLSKLERQVDFIAELETRLAVDNPDADAAGAEPQLVAGSGRLDRRLTFANFVRRATNIGAYNAAYAAADGDATSPNPLFLFGPPGIGKTHLLQALTWRLCARDPGKRVLFLTAAALLTSLIARDTPAFADLPRHVDVLICDDLGGLRNQAAGVDAFDRAIDDLLANGKQVILAADAPPSSMEHLPDRLRSRFVADNSIAVRSNEYDLRLAIVSAMAARRAREKPTFVVPDNVLRMIAAAIKKDARILGAALTRLETHSNGGKAPITFAAAREALADLIRQQRKIYTVNSIKQQVATRYKVRVSDIESRSRKHEFVEPRQLAMYLTRRLTERSYPELGLSFKRDHTTVMHGYDKIHARCLSDPEFAAFIEALVESLDDA